MDFEEREKEINKLVMRARNRTDGYGISDIEERENRYVTALILQEVHELNKRLQKSQAPVDDFDRINEVFRTADKITAEANYDDAKWNLYVEGLNPAEMTVITQWLEHIRPGFIKENQLSYTLGGF